MKLRGSTAIFHILLPALTHSLSHDQHPSPKSTFVATDEPTLSHQTVCLSIWLVTWANTHTHPETGYTEYELS